jgi:hypothetical protein
MRWKKIKGFPDYEISEKGEVRSKSRTSPYLRHKNSKHTRRRDGCVLSPIRTKTGYYQVALFNEWRQHTKHIHRLVAETYLKNPDKKEHVSHKNCDKLDNRVENLEWATPSENIKNGYKILGYKPYSFGKFGGDSHCAKAIIRMDPKRKTKREYPSIRDAGKDGFNETCISKCCHGKQKTHKGFLWSFKEIDRENPRTIIQIL